ncbi:MAG: propanediol utilization protein, partial [Bacteroidetes bacterium]
MFFSVYVQAQDALWEPMPQAEVPPAARRHIYPQVYQRFGLDISALRLLLEKAPIEQIPAVPSQAPVMEIPLSDGKLIRFRVWESPVMEPGLSARYPGIRTYAGRALDDPAMTLRFDLTPQGFHAMIFTQQQGTVFIDPLYQGEDGLYQVYAKQDFVPQAEQLFSCSFDLPMDRTPVDEPFQGHKPLGNCQLRTYRMALSCTGEYAQFHGGTVPLVLGAMVTTMNRINGVYEREFAVRMNLIANNDTLIFLNPLTDPFTNNNGGSLLGENQALTDSLIGDSQYDIGHVFGTEGGGAAAYGAVCGSGFKAIGFTGLGSPVGDPFDIDYVAHEIGHQFAGSHPFRGCGNTDPNTPTAVEPGSGSTIMAYAGICGDNVQLNSDDYFHGYNLKEMSDFIATGGGSTCGTPIALSNTAPQVTGSAQQYIIPQGTPFFLSASASDPDGDPLTYCWEQFDSELSPQPPLPSNTGGPNFRTIKPSSSPTRYFPALQSLANGGPFDWEVLPVVARELHFRVSVRDNAPGGGCADQGSATVTVSDAAGPFAVTSPDTTGIYWHAGGQELVQWAVAGTQLAPISCAEVDILLSTDGGLSYPLVLATGLPNTGTAVVAVPALNTDSARVMVVCAGNIFFDISDHSFSIGPAPQGFVLSTTPNTLVSCAQDSLTLSVQVNATGGQALTVGGLAVSALPQGVVAAFSQDSIVAGGQATLTISGLGAAAPGLYPITVTGTSASGSQSIPVLLTISPDQPGPVLPVAPVNGAIQVPLTPLMAWSLEPGADTYTLQVADNPGFSPILFTQAGLSSNSFQLSEILPHSDTLYWRVQALNACGTGAFGPTYQFATAAMVCTTLVSTGLPLAIDPVDTVTVFAHIVFPVSAVLTDVNVPVLRGTHAWINDLTFSLISPAGTTSTLLGPVCGDEDDFNIRFDDQAAALYSSIPCPPTDSSLYQPGSPMSVFNGQDPLGNWTLRIADSYPQDGGNLTDWSLELCYVPVANANCTLAASATVDLGNCTPCASAIELTVTGATGQTAYLWSDGIRDQARPGVCPGTYTVTVVDAASCATTIDVVVPQVADTLGVSITATPAQGGNGGTASAVTAGGAAPFS